jgi:GT2 family glycosyltransferase
MKTAAIILNHNMPDYTDMLYNSLKPYERGDYDLFVLDNGSSPEGVSKHTSFKLDTNVYFGGGLNASMEFVKENEQYDSLLFLSNDLTIHPYNYVRTLRQEMFQGTPVNEADEIAMLYGGPRVPKFDIIAPTFYNVEAAGQCHWKCMHNHNSIAAREVLYADFQCPLISRRLIEAVGEIDTDLMYGWGPDWYFALTAKKLGYKIGVMDRCCILHHNSLTVKRGVAGLDIPTYCRLAEQGMHNFFAKKNLLTEYHELRAETEKYEYK